MLPHARVKAISCLMEAAQRMAAFQDTTVKIKNVCLAIILAQSVLAHPLPHALLAMLINF